MQKDSTAFSRRNFIAGAAAVAAASAVAPATALAAPTAAEKQAEADAALSALTNMQASLDEASDNYTQALMDQEEAQKRMDQAQERIDELNGTIKEYQGKLSTRARSMYRTGGNTFLDVLVGSSSFEEFASNWSVLNNMNNSDARLVDDTRNARIEMEDTKREYVEQEKIAADRTAEAERIRAQAEHTVAEMQAVYDSLSAEAAALLEEERRAREAAERAAAEAAMRAAAEQAAQQERERAAQAQAQAQQQQQQQLQQQQQQQQQTAVQSAETGAVETVTTPDPEPVVTYTEPEPEPVQTVSNEGGSDAVSRAYSCLGCAYAWGAVGPGSYDCSGLVSYCLSGSHTRLGTTYTFMGWPQVSNPQPGDVCVNSGHCGIYIGNNQMIHAATYGVGVIIGPVQSGMIIVRY